MPITSTLLPLDVSEDRIIRRMTGLRPYRPSGFRIEKEKLDDKWVIHNYGHGGGGVTLSWGTATHAVDLVDAPQGADIAVLGSGVIGLSTALLLQRKGYRVTIYSKDQPPHTTSNIAGALWVPVSIYEPGLASEAFIRQYDRAMAISQKMFLDMVSDRYGVSWIQNFFLGGGYDFPGGMDLYAGLKVHGQDNGMFDFPNVYEVNTLLIETTVYLSALMDDFRGAGGQIRTRSFDRVLDLMSLKERVLMNCTGIGSHQLFGDDSLIPVKGHLALLQAQPEIDYSYVRLCHENLLYMIPRKDEIILGGTFEHGNWSLHLDDGIHHRIVSGHRAIADFLRRSR